MLDLQNMSSDALNAMTKDELITAIIGNQNTVECTQSINGPAGQVLREYTTTDHDGNIVQVEQWSWTYNEAGEVDEIICVTTDGDATVLDASKIVQTGTEAESVALGAEDADASLRSFAKLVGVKFNDMAKPSQVKMVTK